MNNPEIIVCSSVKQWMSIDRTVAIPQLSPTNVLILDNIGELDVLNISCEVVAVNGSTGGINTGFSVNLQPTAGENAENISGVSYIVGSNFVKDGLFLLQAPTLSLPMAIGDTFNFTVAPKGFYSLVINAIATAGASGIRIQTSVPIPE